MLSGDPNRDYWEAYDLLMTIFRNEQEKVYQWLRGKNPNLGDISPIKLIKMGRGHKVLQFIKSVLEENKDDTT